MAKLELIGNFENLLLISLLIKNVTQSLLLLWAFERVTKLLISGWYDYFPFLVQ